MTLWNRAGIPVAKCPAVAFASPAAGRPVQSGCCALKASIARDYGLGHPLDSLTFQIHVKATRNELEAKRATALRYQPIHLALTSVPLIRKRHSALFYSFTESFGSNYYLLEACVEKQESFQDIYQHFLGKNWLKYKRSHVRQKLIDLPLEPEPVYKAT